MQNNLWDDDRLFSWRERERRASRRRRWEIAAAVVCYLTAIGGATALFIALSRAPI